MGIDIERHNDYEAELDDYLGRCEAMCVAQSLAQLPEVVRTARWLQ